MEFTHNVLVFEILVLRLRWYSQNQINAFMVNYSGEPTWKLGKIFRRSLSTYLRFGKYTLSSEIYYMVYWCTYKYLPDPTYE